MHQSERSLVLSKAQRVDASSAPDVGKAALDWQNVQTRLKDTRRKFDAVRDIQPKISSLRARIADLRKEVTDLGLEINTLENRERGLDKQLRDLKAAIGQMEKKKILLSPIEKKLDVANRVVSVIEDAEEALVPLCKQSLEERCTHHFGRMISDEYRGFRVNFNTDQEPTLENGRHTVYVSTLSGAQKRAFGLAFTLAIADVSGQQAPIVVDTPVGNMDSKYRDRVLKHVAEAAPGQVIFLSHDEEISLEYREKILPHVATSMMVNFTPIDEGSGISEVLEGAYF